MIKKLLEKGKISQFTYDYIEDKYDKRKDKDNIFGVGLTDREFAFFIVDELLGSDWYVVDPVNHEQINEIAFYEIIKKYRKRRKRE